MREKTFSAEEVKSSVKLAGDPVFLYRSSLSSSSGLSSTSLEKFAVANSEVKENEEKAGQFFFFEHIFL